MNSNRTQYTCNATFLCAIRSNSEHHYCCRSVSASRNPELEGVLLVRAGFQNLLEICVSSRSTSKGTPEYIQGSPYLQGEQCSQRGTILDQTVTRPEKPASTAHIKVGVPWTGLNCCLIPETSSVRMTCDDPGLTLPIWF